MNPQPIGLPDFIIIGAMRSGTTWLGRALRLNPAIAMAEREVHYFDPHLHRGLEWYANRITEARQSNPESQIVGEKTPEYLTTPGGAAMIREVNPKVKLIAILRNPAKRAFSEYTRALRNENFQSDFQTFLAERPEVLQKGRYATLLADYFQQFEARQIMVLISEEVFASPQSAISSVEDFLGVRCRCADKLHRLERVNESFIPRYRWLYSFGIRIQRRLLKGDNRKLVQIMRRLGLHKLVNQRSRSEVTPKLSPDDDSFLSEYYSAEVETLEKLLDRRIDPWKSKFT